jgi:hypothetical protein
MLILDSAGFRAAAAESILLCLNTIVPSLFAFLALSAFVMSSELVKGDIAVFMLSMVGGYPVGAKLLADRVSENPSYKSRAESMMMYCFCGSPVFLIALTDFGIYVWISNVSACLIFAVIANAGRDVIGTPKIYNDESRPPRPTAELFINSVTSAGITLYKICIMIVMFSVITRLFEFFGITNTIFYAFIEVTNIMNLQTNPAIIAALTSLGGICIIFQVSAICGGRINLRKFLLARIPVAVLSAGICRLMTRNLAVRSYGALETLASNQRIEISSGGSVIASGCLLIMTLLLLATHKSPSSYK